MSALFILAPLVLGAAGGPFTVEGTSLSAKDLVATGKASVTASGLSIQGGRLSLKPASQKTLAAKLAGQPLTLVVDLADAGKGTATAVTVGPVKVGRKADGWYASAGSAVVKLGPGAGLHAVVVANGSMLMAFRDGRGFGSAAYSAGPSAPLVVGSPATEKTPWKGTVRDLQIITRPLTPQDAAAMSESAQVDGKVATVEAELVALTEVPLPKSILPYHEALVTQEYKVLSITSGGIKGVMVGGTIRVARWGIRADKKTALADLKKGAKVTLHLERFEEHQDISKQFTVDKLPDNFDAPYLYDAGI